MNKTKLFGMIALGAILSFSIISCKKGPNDPALSFKSRDGRVTGDWVLSIYERTNTNTNVTSGTTTVTISKETLTGDSIINSLTVDGTALPTAGNYAYSLEMSLNKGGESVVMETINGDLNENTSNWSWFSSNKNKDRLFIDNLGWNMFEVDQLKSKEMVLTIDNTDKDTYTNGDTDETVTTFKYTFTKK